MRQGAYFFGSNHYEMVIYIYNIVVCLAVIILFRIVFIPYNEEKIVQNVVIDYALILVISSIFERFYKSTNYFTLLFFGSLFYLLYIAVISPFLGKLNKKK